MMKPMPISDDFRPFDVVVVPFPFTDRLSEKRRPALIVSRTDRPTRHGYLLLAMITSDVQQPMEGDVAITDLAAAGLSHRSVVRTAKLTTAEAARILRRAGTLPLGTAAAVHEALIGALADPYSAA